MFTIFDNFTRNDATKFLKEVHCYSPNSDCMEVAFLILELHKCISWENNFKFLLKIFKKFDMTEAQCKIEEIVLNKQSKQSNDSCTPLISDTTTNQVIPPTLHFSRITNNTPQWKSENSNSDYYEINDKFPGKCIIFNIENFHQVNNIFNVF